VQSDCSRPAVQPARVRRAQDVAARGVVVVAPNRSRSSLLLNSSFFRAWTQSLTSIKTPQGSPTLALLALSSRSQPRKTAPLLSTFVTRVVASLHLILAARLERGNFCFERG